MTKKNTSLDHPRDSVSWASIEFETVNVCDKRLKNRLIKIAGQFASASQSNIPQACGNWGESKAAYRFCSNDAVDEKEILAAHQRASLGRIRQQAGVILAIQDTTSLNFTTHPQTEGLGPIGANRDKTIGLLMHSTLAVTEQGLALGLLNVDLSARDPKKFRVECKKRNRKPIEEKESFKWLQGLKAVHEAAKELPPECRMVSVCDREADIYELFAFALRAEQSEQWAKVDLLVRSKHERQITEKEGPLWKGMEGRAAEGELVVEVPPKAGQKSRKAILSIRYSKVTLESPVDRKKYQKLNTPLTLWAVEAREENAPNGVEPLCWRLLTTMRVDTFEQAVEKVKWYTKRWQIEVFHKILKSGCKVQDRQLETAERLKRALMIDAVVAWRILALSRMGRETPGTPADALLAEHEWKALYSYIHKTGKLPKNPPNMGEALGWIAKLGGFLGRKGDGFPGAVVIWRGLQRLADLAEGWRIFNPANTKDVGNA